MLFIKIWRSAIKQHKMHLMQPDFSRQINISETVVTMVGYTGTANDLTNGKKTKSTKKMCKHRLKRKDKSITVFRELTNMLAHWAI